MTSKPNYPEAVERVRQACAEMFLGIRPRSVFETEDVQLTVAELDRLAAAVTVEQTARRALAEVMAKALNAKEAAEGEVKKWAKLALDINTYAAHDIDCDSLSGIKPCSCGYSATAARVIDEAEALSNLPKSGGVVEVAAADNNRGAEEPKDGDTKWEDGIYWRFNSRLARDGAWIGVPKDEEPALIPSVPLSTSGLSEGGETALEPGDIDWLRSRLGNWLVEQGGEGDRWNARIDRILSSLASSPMQGEGQEPIGCPCPGACSMKGPLTPDQRASIICDFMNWPEDGPAWADAHKLAAKLAAPKPDVTALVEAASGVSKATRQMPSGEWIITGDAEVLSCNLADALSAFQDHQGGA